MNKLYAGKSETKIILALFFVLVLTVFSFDLKATESALATDCKGVCLQTLEWAPIEPEARNLNPPCRILI